MVAPGAGVPSGSVEFVDASNRNCAGCRNAGGREGIRYRWR